MYGYGPGPYLFEGPEGLEAALEAAEHGVNLLEVINFRNKMSRSNKSEAATDE
jgi:hypothetical protein